MGKRRDRDCDASVPEGLGLPGPAGPTQCAAPGASGDRVTAGAPRCRLETRAEKQHHPGRGPCHGCVWETERWKRPRDVVDSASPDRRPQAPAAGRPCCPRGRGPPAAHGRVRPHTRPCPPPAAPAAGRRSERAACSQRDAPKAVPASEGFSTGRSSR